MTEYEISERTFSSLVQMIPVVLTGDALDRLYKAWRNALDAAGSVSCQELGREPLAFSFAPIKDTDE